MPSVALAAWLCVGTAVAMVVAAPDCLHWFIVPVVLCGMVIGTDAVDWMRGRLDVFDPVGLLGLFGLHFFFAAPLLHVSQDFWIDTWSTVVDLPPSDWRPWVGGMALLNLAGLLIYRRLSRVSQEELEAAAQRPAWRLESSRFICVFPALLALCCLVQLVVVQRFGGLGGYTQAYEEEGFRAFEGWGRTMLLSESAPLLAFIAFAVLSRGSSLLTSKVVLCGGLCVFLVLCLLFGGLRGARGYTVWNLFWAVGIVHFCLRPIPRRWIVVGLVFLATFMYAYGFYKWGGRDALGSLFDARARANWVGESNKGFLRTLLFDLGRCDVQAYLLYQLYDAGDYEYACGRTYLGAVVLFVPESIWPDRPPTKVKEGTEIQYGMGSFVPDEVVSLWCYGMSGETMLNFPPVLIPVGFGLFGLLVRRVRRAAASLDEDDSRRLLVPLWIAACFYVLVWDSDNLVTFLVKCGSIPSLAVAVCSVRVPSQRRLEVSHDCGEVPR